MSFIILPNQLYEIKILKKIFNKDINDNINSIIICEHPQYFKKYKFNKKKLLLHFSTMNYYNDLLKNNFKNLEIKYIKYDKKKELDNLIKNKDKKFYMFEPSDKLKEFNKKNIILLDNPNFLLNNKLREEYSIKTSKTKSVVFNDFYMWSKKQLNIIPNIKSKDQENRKVFKSNKALPKLPKLSSTDTKYLNSNLIKLNNFKNNYGVINNINNYIYPITHKTAKVFLKDFINKRFNNFGDYQDYIKKDEAFMFHSVLSSSLNIGLLNPSDVIEEVMKYKNKIPLNSFEGFIRQLFWREYQMYCYKYIDFDYYLKNYNKSSNHQSLFSYSNKLNKSWYNGTIKIDNIDMTIINDTINKGFENAYLHHIERLMVMGNFMNIYELHPKQGFKWFMEFSIDSYEWVMYQNVYDMVFYITGLTMRKPYITTSNYVLSISDYNIKEDKEWINKWDEMFYKFLKKYKTQIQKKHSYYFPSLKKI